MNIQLLAGKEKMQKELILPFNELCESDCRIMSTTNGVLDERLLARRFFGEYATI